MKPVDILATLEPWRSMDAGAIVDSPAWAMPCRLGEEQILMRPAAVRPSDTLALAIRFGDAPHTLALAPSPRFPELSRLWESRAEVPEPILLALVERECAPLLQLLENAVRRELAIDGLGGEPSDGDIAADVGGITFTLTRSQAVVAAFGQLRFLDPAHPAIRGATCHADCEYATFALDQRDAASLAVGDAIVVPEIESTAPRLVVEGKILLADGDSSPFSDDGLCHVRSAAPICIALVDIFDGSAKVPPVASPLRLAVSGRAVATCRLDRLGEQPALVVESKE